MTKALTIQTYTIEEIDNDINFFVKEVYNSLNKGVIGKIERAFRANTLITECGSVFFRVKGLNNIIRTGNGAERILVYQGISGDLPKAEIVEINGEEYISAPSLSAIYCSRLSTVTGKTLAYLEASKDMFEQILRNYNISIIRGAYIDKIEKGRKQLKRMRIDRYSITRCEFTGKTFYSLDEVEFAHINSVVTDLENALNIDNGVIILKEIHKQITKSQLHTLDELIDFCKYYNYSLNWLD